MSVIGDGSALLDEFLCNFSEFILIINHDEIFDAVDQFVNQVPLFLLFVERARRMINSNSLVAFPSSKIVPLLLPIVLALLGKSKVRIFEFIHALRAIKQRLYICGNLFGQPVKIDEVIHVVLIE